MNRTIASAAIIATAIGATATAEAASTCRDVARHMESGSVALPREPVLIVPARRGRCVLILSGWGIQPDSEHLFGSGSVNIGDANIDSGGTAAMCHLPLTRSSFRPRTRCGP
jgi:hypothetical protein